MCYLNACLLNMLMAAACSLQSQHDVAFPLGLQVLVSPLVRLTNQANATIEVTLRPRLMRSSLIVYDGELKSGFLHIRD